MADRNKSTYWHVCALILFCAAIAGIWYLPVLLSGYSYEIPHLHPARNFADTGTFTMKDSIGRYVMSEHHPAPTSAKDGRLSTVLFASVSPWIGWDNMTGWALLSIIIVAVALIPLWFAIAGLFNRRIAWISIILTALMPIYWKKAIYLSNLQLALLFLFLSFAAFILLRKNHWRALAVSGLFFGLSIAAKDLFLIFMPWYVISYAWIYKSNWRRVLKGCFLFFGLTFCVYLVPYIGDIKEHGYPINWNIARVWPGAEEMANETYLHLYPDPYTYHFEREAFDESILRQAEDATVLERAQMQKTLRAYGVGDWNFLRVLKNSVWLFVNSIPSFFHLGIIGGVFLWLFILPGAAVLWKDDSRMTLLLGGLVLTTYIIIRFVLGYNREHFEDIGWVLAILAAIGVVSVSDFCASHYKKISVNTASVVITFIIALQLLQANRIELARLYRRPLVTDTLSVAHAVSQTPEMSVVAMPLHPMRTSRITYLSGRTTVIFVEETLERLLENRGLTEAFDTYGVTHIARYSEDLTAEIRKTMPSITIVVDDAPGAQPPKVTTFIRYLLHHIY